MSHAIRFHKTGGPEVLVWEEVEIGKPGPGEAHVRHTAVGVNFVDIYWPLSGSFAERARHCSGRNSRGDRPRRQDLS
jgi:NADPH:quinone reductase-like Zn-dependent oxidoreductase